MIRDIFYVEIQGEIEGKKSSVKKIDFSSLEKRNDFMDAIAAIYFIRIVGFGQGVWSD